MTGILLLAVVGLWLWVSMAATRALLRRLHARPWRWLVGLPVFVALLVAPVADEIVGGFQFRALCKKNAVFRFGAEKPEGRMTKELISPANEILTGTAITIYHTGVTYTDIKTNELVVKFDKYVAKGGMFIRTLGIFESDAPITIGRPSCSPEQVRGEAIHHTLKFSVVN